jgi:multidrug efflux pump subunit AcrB
MTLYTLSIRRPVLALVMTLVIVLFGAIGFSRPSTGHRGRS